MRPLVPLIAFVALLLPACASDLGPSSTLVIQPAAGAGARVFSSPQDGIGAAARIVHVEKRVTVLESNVTRLLASVGEHRHRGGDRRVGRRDGGGGGRGAGEATDHEIPAPGRGAWCILTGVNMVAPLKTFGDRIKRLREGRNLTVRDLAALIRASAGYVSRVEVRGEIPSPEMICRLAEALHASPESLLAAAKEEQLASAKGRIESRHADALRLYRKSR